MDEKPKRKVTDEFVVPYSLQESIYRILETKGKDGRYFTPLVGKLNSDCYSFCLQSKRIATRVSLGIYHEVRPVVQIEGQLQALDETNTLVTAHLRVDWFMVIIFALVLPIVLFIIESAYLSMEAAGFILTTQLLVLSFMSLVARRDYYHLKSLLYEAMSE